jgi:ferredoxin-NADP reductase
MLKKDALYADFINFVYVSIAFWCFDKAVRLLRVLFLNGIWDKDGRFCSSTGVVRLLDGTDNILSMSVTLTGRGARRWLCDPERVTSGLNIQLWIPRVHPLSSHPFTVASIEEKGDSVRLQLYALVKKGITSRLLKKVQLQGGQSEMSMMVEGFYGKQIQTPKTHNHIYVAGGIGITSSISYLQDAVRHGIDSHLIWLIPTAGETAPFQALKKATSLTLLFLMADMIAIAIDVFKNMPATSKLEHDSRESPGRQAMSIYITRPSKTIVPISDMSEKQSTQDSKETLPFDVGSSSHHLNQLNHLHPLLDVRVTLLHSRPVLSELVMPLVRPMQTTLFCCGPAQLLDAARYISRHNDVDYHEEAFAW